MNEDVNNGALLTRETPASEARGLDAMRREPRGVWQLLCGVVLFFLGGLLPQFIAAPIAAAFAGQDWVESTVRLGLSAAIAVAGFMLIVPWLARRKPYELMGPGAWREFGLGAAIGAGLIAVAALILWLCGAFRITDVSLNGGIILGLMVGIGAGFGEEILFRGFLTRLLDKWFGAWVAVITVSLVFGALHIMNPEATVWGCVAIILTAGPLLGGAYLLTRRLWLAIGIHAAWNAMQAAVLGINVSGSGNDRGLFASELTGPELLTGGDMGIEGSIVLVVLAASAGAAMLVIAHRRGLMLPRRRSLLARDL